LLMAVDTKWSWLTALISPKLISNLVGKEFGDTLQ